MTVPVLQATSEIAVCDVRPGDVVRYGDTVYRVSETMPNAKLDCWSLTANAADGSGGWCQQRVSLLYANQRADAELITGGIW